MSYATRIGQIFAPSQTQPASRNLGHMQYLGTPQPAQQTGGDEDPGASQLARLFTQTSRQKLVEFAKLPADWDGRGSAAPRADSVANASTRLSELYRLATAHGVWREPHISSSEDGDVTFEWWSGRRKVTVYFGDDDGIEVLRVWGVDVAKEMELLHLSTLEGFVEVWSWLYGN
jgi:hypothetical protein